jgi:hypothetical protein
MALFFPVCVVGVCVVFGDFGVRQSISGWKEVEEAGTHTPSLTAPSDDDAFGLGEHTHVPTECVDGMHTASGFLQLTRTESNVYIYNALVIKSEVTGWRARLQGAANRSISAATHSQR